MRFAFLLAPIAAICPTSAGASSFTGLHPEAPRTEQAAQETDRKAEFKARYAAAKGDLEALWELHEWCDAFGLESEDKRVLRAILKLDDSDRKAHEGLGHIEHEGNWFKDQKELSKHLAKAAEKEGRAKGFVKFKDQWVDPKHLPFLEKGLVLSPDGEWITAELQQRIENGWKRQDLDWVSPEEFSKLDEGLWKVGEQWLSLEEANEHHAKLGSWWKIPGETFELWTTLPRDKAEEALAVMERSVFDLKKFYGRLPESRARVVLLDSINQYNELGSGNFEATETESQGLSSAYTGYFADIWWDVEKGEFLRAAVAYWDTSSDASNRFGIHAARFAAGMALTEALDPSPKFEAKFAKKLRGEQPEYKSADLRSFWSEKKLPNFLRYGVPVWNERFFVDRSATGNGADPFWARKWSISNINRRGGTDSISKILSLGGENQAQDIGKLFIETGLLVSFIVNGNHAEVTAAYDVWRKAFNGEGDLEKATEALRGALLNAEEAIWNYANESE